MSKKRQVQVIRQALNFTGSGEERIVTGPVMVASPEFVNGQTVAPEDLVNVVHFDGAFMTQAEVAKFAHRFLTKRPSHDLEHDGIPRRAWTVESFLTREDGDLPAGSHIVSAMSLDSEVNAQIDDGTLRAWSAQLMVSVEPIVVNLQTNDGETPLLLVEFANGDPQFLSFVKHPAIGVLWSEVKRDLSLSVAPKGWSMDSARSRIFDWAMVDGAVSVGLAAKFFPDFARSGFECPVGDIVGGTPTLYAEAVRDACDLALGGQNVARVIRVMRSDVENGMAKWEGLMNDIGIKTRSKDTAAPATAAVEEKREEVAAPVASSETTEETLSAEPTEEKLAATTNDATTEVERSSKTFDEIVADQLPEDVFWAKCWGLKSALSDAFWYAMWDSDLDAGERQAQMVAAVASFSTFMTSTVNDLFGSMSAELSGDASSLELGDAMRTMIKRAGAVLSKSNKADIELASERLQTVLERAKKAEDEDIDEEDEDGEAKLSTESTESTESARTEEPVPAPAADMAETIRGMLASAVSEIRDTFRSEMDSVKRDVAEVKKNAEEATKEVEKVRSAAPAPSSPSGAADAAAATESSRNDGSEESKRGASWGGLLKIRK